MQISTLKQRTEGFQSALACVCVRVYVCVSETDIMCFRDTGAETVTTTREKHSLPAGTLVDPTNTLFLTGLDSSLLFPSSPYLEVIWPFFY